MSKSSQVTVAAEPDWPRQQPCEHSQCVLHSSSLSTWRQDRTTVVLTLQKWCLQSCVTATATAQVVNEFSLALLAKSSPFLMPSWAVVPCPTVPGSAASLWGLELLFHLGQAGTGKHSLPCCQASAGKLVLQISSLLSASEGTSLIWKQPWRWQVFIPCGLSGDSVEC